MHHIFPTHQSYQNIKMEGMRGFSDAEFDLLGMLFPGNDPDGTCMSLSQYSMVDTESPYAAHAAGVNTPGLDEDYSNCSLDNVDSSFQWSSRFYVPVADLSTIVNSERIRDEILKDDSHVQMADSMPPEGRFVDGKGSKHKRKPIAAGEDTAVEISETTKKRPRQSRVTQKRQEVTRTRRHRKSSDAVDNETNDNKNSGDGENPRQEGQSPITCCSSEDDVNSQQLGASDNLNLKALSAPNNNGAAKVKPRAGRGAATDPQSLYARKRRGRINERLKILQNLIPNGTKVDISTMLEEAVHYVKFLQLQIKLLSSDEMWMYAPMGKTLV